MPEVEKKVAGWQSFREGNGHSCQDTGQNQRHGSFWNTGTHGSSSIVQETRGQTGEREDLFANALAVI